MQKIKVDSIIGTRDPEGNWDFNITMSDEYDFHQKGYNGDFKKDVIMSKKHPVNGNYFKV